MSYYSFRRVDQILKNESFGTTNSLDQIHAIDWECWAEIAGNAIADHTQVVLNGKSGIVYANSPVWAHTVNQQRIRLLKAMRNKGFFYRLAPSTQPTFRINPEEQKNWEKAFCYSRRGYTNDRGNSKRD